MVCLKISTDGATPIWSIIEMQGDIVLPEDWQDQDFIELGTLSLSPEDVNVVRLTFGQHQLEGKLVTLKSPLAILDAPIGSKSGADPLHTVVSERKIIGLVQQKYVFKTRPKPLITKPEL
mmetsp:Transcript_1336/g.3994  ORF Transcript_1336/g.3994 Transcript_1336/m.3994 type:complete len:120 (+) Transcript_1336:311-670(+)